MKALERINEIQEFYDKRAPVAAVHGDDLGLLLRAFKVMREIAEEDCLGCGGAHNGNHDISKDFEERMK